jgi:serine/threonine protein kinase
VAVKELRKDNANVARHWAKEVSALSKMNTLNMEHIVRFLTAFTRGNSNGRSEGLEHFVVFEWAEGGNLKNLWGHFPRQDRSAVFIKWIMKQLYGLSQALKAAHYLFDDDGVYRDASYRHGDLKPENILWFPWEGSDWGTLKICDWGEAKIHREVTGLRHHTTTQFGTRRYEPPEAVVGESELSEAAKDARSRLYDIWSMGCVMMECTIWLVYGMDELRRFNKSNLGDHNMSDFFYESHREGNKVRKVVHGAVNRWLKHMKNDPFCRPGQTAIGDALEIISKGLLVVQLPTRVIRPYEVTDVRDTHPSVVKEPFPPQPSLILSSTVDSDPGSYHPLKQTMVLHLPKTTIPRVQGFTTGVSIPAEHPGINITPAEDVSTHVEKEELSSEPERYSAIDLADQLSKIVNGGHDNRYWLASGSATPVPHAPRNDSQLSLGPRDRLHPINGRNAVTKPKDNGNYAHPELDRDRWTFEVDNDFAASVLHDRNHMQIVSGAGSSSPRLCGKCAAIQKRLWSPLFQETFTTEELRQNTDNDVCHLCCLFWQACIQNEATDWREIVFERIDSSLKISGTKSPAVSLFRDNGKPATAMCTACC